MSVVLRDGERARTGMDYVTSCPTLSHFPECLEMEGLSRWYNRHVSRYTKFLGCNVNGLIFFDRVFNNQMNSKAKAARINYTVMKRVEQAKEGDPVNNIHSSWKQLA